MESQVPQALVDQALAILPDIAMNTIELAWNQSKNVEGQELLKGEQREQLALNLLFDICLIPSQEGLIPANSSQNRDDPFYDHDARPDLPRQEAEGAAGPAPKGLPRAPSSEEEVGIATPPQVVEKGKGKAKVISFIEISDDEDEEPVRRPGNGKGKGREEDSTDGVKNNNKRDFDFITLGDSSPDGPPQKAQKRKAATSTTPPPHVDPIKVVPELTKLESDLAIILAVLPDILPSYALEKLEQHIAVAEANGGAGIQDVAEAVINEAFSDEKGYPKTVKEGREEVEKKENPKIDYLDWTKRGKPSRAYSDACFDQLLLIFPHIPKPIVRNFFLEFGSFYAPAYFELAQQCDKTDAEREWKALNNPRGGKGKGKAKELTDELLKKEMEWVETRVDLAKMEEEDAKLRELRAEEELKKGEFFACGCCFSDTGFSLLVTCTEGCQFCKDCATAYVESKIGDRQYMLPCMSTDGCSAFISLSIAETFLSTKLMETLHKIKQEKEVDLAELTGLVKCPFCPFAIIIENEEEKLLKCERDECGRVSCLQCQQEDHLPKSCAEVAEDKKIGGLHLVEEAMSAALIRKCPKCSAPYLKEAGCNKITCMTCRTMSCYICMKVVAGYQHFKNAGSNAAFTEAGASCLLWDDSDKRNYDEVEAARVAAAAQIKDNDAIEAADLEKLNLPKPPPVPKPVNPHAADMQRAQQALELQRDQIRAQAAVIEAQIQAYPRGHQPLLNFQQLFPVMAAPARGGAAPPLPLPNGRLAAVPPPLPPGAHAHRRRQARDKSAEMDAARQRAEALVRARQALDDAGRRARPPPAPRKAARPPTLAAALDEKDRLRQQRFAEYDARRRNAEDEARGRNAAAGPAPKRRRS